MKKKLDYHQEEKNELLDVDFLLKNFKVNLQALCDAYRETQITLAEKIDCNHGTISNYLSGKTLPTLDMIIKISNYFKITPNELIGYPTEKEIKLQAYFSERTGLSKKSVAKLFDYGSWKEHEQDIEALNYLIQYNEEDKEALTILRCLYEAIYHQPMKIDITDADALEAYYNNTEFFLQPHIYDRDYVPIGDIYLLLFNKKIKDMISDHVITLKKVQKKQKEILENIKSNNKKNKKQKDDIILF